MRKNTLEIGEAPIGKLLWKQSLPAAIGMLVMVLYNTVDTIYVGRGVGTMAIAAIAVVLPISMFISFIGMAIGIGGASIISRALGAHDIDKANQTLGNLISLTIIISVALMGVGYFFTDNLLLAFGAKGEILPFAREYFLIIMGGTPFIATAMMANNVIRAEGHAKVAMFTMIFSAVLNMILDPILIFGLNMGLQGAAIATVISQFTAFAYINWHFLSGNSTLEVKLIFLKLKKAIVRETFSLGITSFARQASMSILVLVINNMSYHYGGEIAVAVYGILNRIFMFSIFPILGLLQGFLPVVGFNYGAGHFGRVRRTLKLANIYGTLICVVSFFFLMLFSESVISIFTTDPVLIEMSTHAIRLLVIAFPLMALQMLGAAYFQAIGKAVPAFILTLAKQGLLLIPLALILPSFFKLDGVWIAFPVSDILATILTLIYLWPYWKRLGEQ